MCGLAEEAAMPSKYTWQNFTVFACTSDPVPLSLASMGLQDDGGDDEDEGEDEASHVHGLARSRHITHHLLDQRNVSWSGLAGSLLCCVIDTQFGTS